MKKILYLMRHGQTQFNVRRKIQGWCDSPLTPLGIAQAKVAAAYFKDHDITFDHAYASTSERVCQIYPLFSSSPVAGPDNHTKQACLMQQRKTTQWLITG